MGTRAGRVRPTTRRSVPECAWSCAVAGATRPPSDRPSPGEPSLAVDLRSGSRQDLGRLRRDGRPSLAPRATRLARGGVCGVRLEFETCSQVDSEFGDLSPEHGSDRGEARKRSTEPLPHTRPPGPPGCRGLA